MNHLRRLGNQISIPIHTDSDGYLGRECPVPECLGYFKVTPGTGIKAPAPGVCLYCGHSGDNNTFFTQEQIEYARSVEVRRITHAVHADLKSFEFEQKPRGMFGIGVNMKLSRSAPQPIRYYRERELETHVVCDHCTLRFAIYGVFAGARIAACTTRCRSSPRTSSGQTRAQLGREFRPEGEEFLPGRGQHA